jgi:hypothetical protein
VGEHLACCLSWIATAVGCRRDLLVQALRMPEALAQTLPERRPGRQPLAQLRQIQRQCIDNLAKLLVAAGCRLGPRRRRIGSVGP